MIAGLLQLVPADGVSPDQQNALAAVMLGIVVFAAIFLLVERRRNRQAKQAKENREAEEAELSGPPAAPMVAPNPAEPQSPQLYRPPLANREEKVPDPMPPVTPPAAGPEPLPATPPEAPPAAAGTPASPDEIGIVLPEDQPPSGPGGSPPAG